MPLSLIPSRLFRNYREVTPEFLRKEGVTLLLSDLDFTLAPKSVRRPDPDLRAWIEEMKTADIQVMIVSNNRSGTRVTEFCADLGIPYQGRSGKPKKAGYLRAMERMGARPQETVMVGDQIFTDTLGANNAGVIPLLVEPIRLAGNPGRYIRYAVEMPFRLLGKRRPFL